MRSEKIVFRFLFSLSFLCGARAIRLTAFFRRQRLRDERHGIVYSDDDDDDAEEERDLTEDEISALPLAQRRDYRAKLIERQVRARRRRSELGLIARDAHRMNAPRRSALLPRPGAPVRLLPARRALSRSLSELARS